jgi:tRNA A37 threonylcarbamoyladenosine modification protein TsaB
MNDKKQLHLIIDSSHLQETTVTLEGDDIHASETIPSSSHHSQVLLPLIEKLVTNSTHQLSDITGIYVRTETGSFTGRRVGVAIAEMLGILLSVPVNDMPPGTTIDIPYEEDKWK